MRIINSGWVYSRSMRYLKCRASSGLTQTTTVSREPRVLRDHPLLYEANRGTLPFRLLAAEYGADIVYGEEIVDHKLIKCNRQVNAMLGTIDFVDKISGEVVFRTCSLEKHQVVCQIGTADATRALCAAQSVSRDVAAFDVNMGCPKSFSISGGMGASLLSRPDTIHEIMTTLKRNLNVPVTCKIRLLKTTGDTIELAKRIERTGACGIAVHGRKIADKPRDPAQWGEIAAVVSALSIPVIANGDVFKYSDFQRIKDVTGASSVMVARGALWNASIFQMNREAYWEDVKHQYLRKCFLWDNDIKRTKHTIKKMIMHHSCLELPEGKSVNQCQSLADLADFYGERVFYDFTRDRENSLQYGL